MWAYKVYIPSFNVYFHKMASFHMQLLSWPAWGTEVHHPGGKVLRAGCRTPQTLSAPDSGNKKDYSIKTVHAYSFWGDHG